VVTVIRFILFNSTSVLTSRKTVKTVYLMRTAEYRWGRSGPHF